MDADDRPGAIARFRARVESWPAVLLPVSIAVIASVVRAVTLVQERAGNPLLRLAILDDRNYLDLARAVLNGEASDRPWFLAPLYPFTLAQCARISGLDLLTASCLAVVCGTVTAVLVALAARRLHSPLAGYVAGLLQACAGTFVFHDVLPGQEPLLALLHAAGLLVALRLLDGRLARTAVLLGLITGVAILGRATSVVIVLASLAVVLPRLHGARSRVVISSAAALGLALVLVPAAVRNLAVTGDFTPLPWSGGPNLYMANGPDARERTTFGAFELGAGPQEMEVRAREVAEKDAGHALRPSEISAFWRARTLDSLTGVGDTAEHLAKKALLFWSAQEFGSNHYVELEREYASWLRWIPVGAWWILALAAGGFVLVRRGRPGADVAALAVLGLWALLVIVFPVSRYRLPVLPLAVVLVGAGVAEALRRTDDPGEPPPASRRRRLVAAGVTLTLGLAAFVPQWTGMLGSRASPSYLNLATAFRMQGDDWSAERILRRSIEAEPDDGPVLEELARTLIDRAQEHNLPGPLMEAIELLGKAELDQRTHYSAGAAACYAWLVRGRPDIAARALGYLTERADQLDPRTAVEIAAYRAVLRAVDGDTEGAETELRRLARVMPDHPALARARKLISAR